MIPNAVSVAGIEVDRQAAFVLIPVAARQRLSNLPDELVTKINIEFYGDAPDAVLTSKVEWVD
jgi:ATP-dependent Lon protease